jgi:hypothetical protein
MTKNAIFDFLRDRQCSMFNGFFFDQTGSFTTSGWAEP